MSVTQGATIMVERSGDRGAWRQLVDPPGAIPSGGREADVFSTVGGALTTGFWEREPDTWSFERAYDEVALILEGDADIVTDDGRTLTIGPGDVLVTPKGSAGTWVIRERVVKFWVIYDGGQIHGA
ncbi:MAG TPA: cupin domain-containing protein [Actinomycetota bacterium]|nr:cupin domain-containing protein [Actinomycetota bacterium]